MDDIDEASEGHDAAPAPIEAFRLAPGVVVPGTRYRITGWLGEGGMGVVYEAEHIELGRKVAIKVLAPGPSADPRKAAHFREEARAATRIGSPWIVDVEDFARLPDGRLVYVMELLRGPRLDAEVERAPMALPRLLGILRQACKALGAAHAERIVHRDIKPENIVFVEGAERPDTIKIMDFGVAAMVGGRAGVSGTPYYMAPEQIAGIGFTAHVDIYALGCVAYEALTGTPPFMAADVREVLRAHVKTPPAPPSQLIGAEACPPAVEAVILRCLEKRPKDRFASMAELEAAICEAQIELGVATAWDQLPLPEVDAARQAQIRARMPKAPRERERARAPAVVAVAGATALVTAIASYLWLTPPAGQVDAVTGEVQALVEQAREAAAKSHYVYPPPDAPDAPTSYGSVLALEQLAASGADEAAARLRDEYASTLVYLGDQYWERPGGRAFAVDYYAQALLFEPDDARGAERGMVTPGQLALLGRKARDGEFTPAELTAAEPLIALADADETRRARRLAAIRDRTEPRSPRATAEIEALLESIDKPAGGGSPQASRPGGAAGPAAPAPAPPAAAPASAPAGAESEDAHPPGPTTSPASDPARARAIAEDGQVALAASRLDEAGRLFHSALRHDRRCGAALIGLSDMHFERGEYDRAVQFAQKAVAAAPKRAAYRLKLGDAYFKVLKYAQARAEYEQARALGDARARARITKLDRVVGR